MAYPPDFKHFAYVNPNAPKGGRVRQLAIGAYDNFNFVISGLSGDPPRGTVRRVPVELGLDDGKRAEIRKGLDGSERVIAKGNGVVREGDTVIAVPVREP